MKQTLREEIRSEIETMDKDEKLYREKNVNIRLDAIDFIEFHVIDRIHALMESSDTYDQMVLLKQYATKVKHHLEAVNTNMFRQLRKKISQEGYQGKLLMNLIEEHFDNNLSTILRHDAIGYDNLDLFLNGLITYQELPVETRDREPEMVYYQKTPGRIILELIKKATFKPQDIFFDLGSGLGQVTILVNLLTSVISKGVEIEPAFCSYAHACAADLNLKDVEFINMDARYVDYSSGTIFFMYTAFEGKMLQECLQNLRGEAKKRTIKIFTFGPCILEVANQNWLVKINEIQNYHLQACEFHSL